VAGYGAGLPENFRELFPVGTAVTCEETLWCAACSACRAGKMNYCERLRVLGDSHEGAHAEYLTVPARACWSLQPLVDKFGLDSALRYGSLAGSYGLAYRALFADERGGPAGWLPGDRILILGGGPQGLAALDLARAAGAAEIHVLEIDPSRRQTARELGASLALAPEDAETLGIRYDRVIDAAGSAELMNQVLRNQLAPGAAVSFLSPATFAMTISTEALSFRGARVVAVQGQSGGIMERVVRLLAEGRLQPEKLIRETVTLEQALQRLMLQKKAEGKILVRHGNA
jgi:threonine dehydrogenase-like Zn-dependent dehydrogenase